MENIEQQQNKSKANKYLLVLIVIVIILIGYIVTSSIRDSINKTTKQTALILNETIRNATIIGYNQGIYDVVSSITQTGNIPYWDNSTGNLTIQTKSITDICSGK